MKIKIQELINLKEFCVRLKDKELDINTAYKLYKLTKLIEENYSFYNEKLSEILIKCCELDENNKLKIVDGNYIIKTENKNDFSKDVLSLQNLEIEIEEIKFTFEELKDLKLSSSDINNLIKFIKE